MIQELRDLYQEVILDHNKHPRHYGKLDHFTHSAEGVNPLCGDKQTLQLQIENNIVTNVAFENVGCAISTASASLMAEILIGKSIIELQTLFTEMQILFTQENTFPESLGKLKVLAGVREYPARVKCATLPWHTLNAALSHETAPTSTE
jgi:nitrogen fixation NifU-like protein